MPIYNFKKVQSCLFMTLIANLRQKESLWLNYQNVDSNFSNWKANEHNLFEWFLNSSWYNINHSIQNFMQITVYRI